MQPQDTDTTDESPRDVENILKGLSKRTLQDLISGNELLNHVLVERGCNEEQIEAVEAILDVETDSSDACRTNELPKYLERYLRDTTKPVTSQLKALGVDTLNDQQFGNRLRSLAHDYLKANAEPHDVLERSTSSGSDERGGGTSEERFIALAEQLASLKPREFVHLLQMTRPSKESILSVAQWAVQSITKTSAAAIPLAARLIRLTPTNQIHKVLDQAELSDPKRHRIHLASQQKSKGNVTEDSSPSNKSPASGLPAVDQIDKDRERQIGEATRREFFGDAAPSINGLREYLRRLRKKNDTSYDEKRQIAKALTFWRRELGVVFIYDGQPCSIKARPSGGQAGAFQVRALGASRKPLKSSIEFPALLIRKVAS